MTPMWNWVVDFLLVTLVVGCFGWTAAGGGMAPMARVVAVFLAAILVSAVVAGLLDAAGGLTHRHRHP